MMKKAFLVCLLLVSVALAQPLPPMPIPVKVLTYGYSGGIAVTATNQRTLETVVQYTDQSGETIIEWANTVQKYQSGDIFAVKVLDKVKTVYAPDVPILVYDFVSSCPDVQYPTPTPYIIECPTPIACSTPEPAKCDEQPTDTFAIAVSVIISFIAGAGTVGYGIKMYRKTTGEVATVHKHRGIKAYHSPDIVHSNVKYRHKKGQLNPKYDSEGNYQG